MPKGSGGAGREGRGSGSSNTGTKADSQQPGEVVRAANKANMYVYSGPNFENSPNYDKAIENYAEKMGSSPDVVAPRVWRKGNKERIYSSGTKYSYYITKNAADIQDRSGSGKMGKWTYQLFSKETRISKQNIGRLIGSLKKYGVD